MQALLQITQKWSYNFYLKSYYVISKSQLHIAKGNTSEKKF